ncbi:MAG TPA: hypothetical protein VFZ09_28850 [Archangium sp.]|uniref:hypothetical protein n=1 Tax=Archangium sp. TaxID=1872627 RepID=UPI002E2FC41C|nr:hypothetical protein [Archangium sp.]HEX5750275.1 hypothetical protein [Archangium sp.]
MAPPASSIVVDDSLWPLVRVTFPRVITHQQQAELLERVLSYLRRGERHVALVDFRQLQALTSEQREQQWNFLREQAVPMRQWSMGIVALINSPTLALVTRTIIHRIKPSVVPHSIVASWPAAVSWAADRLRDNGLAEHASLVRQRLGTAPGSRVG